MLWPFKFLESFRCSFLSVSIYYAPESDIRVKSYDHLNLSRASVVHFRAFLYIKGFTQTPESKVMAVWICRELTSLERLDILCAWIGHPCEMLWPFELGESFHCSFSSVSIYHGPHTYTQDKIYDRFNLSRASVFNFERLDILCPWIELPSEIYDHLNFSRASIVGFRASRNIMGLTHAPE